MFDHLVEKINPYLQSNLQKEASDCDEEVPLKDTEAALSRFRATSTRDKLGILNEHERYNVELRTDGEEDDPEEKNSLIGEINFDLQRTGNQYRNDDELERAR